MSAEPTPAGAEAGAHGVYVYGVIPASSPLPESLEGLGLSHRPRTVLHGDVAAVVSEVPLADFGEEQLREHYNDLTWLEATARAHAAVLDTLRDSGTVIPMRLCTIYRQEDGLREMLEREGPALARALGELVDKSEWGLKLFAPSPRRAPAPGPAEKPSSGTAYLRMRQAERARREDRDQELEKICAEIHMRVGAAACDAQVLALQARELTGREDDMLLNGVYLVEEQQLEMFFEEVEAAHACCSEQRLELECTGPWPAYHFTAATIGPA